MAAVFLWDGDSRNQDKAELLELLVSVFNGFGSNNCWVVRYFNGLFKVGFGGDLLGSLKGDLDGLL